MIFATMEVIFHRNAVGARKNWSAFVRLLREQATLMDLCGVTNGKSRNEPKMHSPKEVEVSGPSSAGSKDQGGRTGNRHQQKKTKDARDAAESAKNIKPTPYGLNRSTCEARGTGFDIVLLHPRTRPLSF
jgi:hypothetical protein